MKSLIYTLLVILSFGVLSQSTAEIVLSFYIDENSPNGTLIGAVSATDPDGDVLVYSISSGNEAGGFEINAETGDIVVKDQEVLDFETSPKFELTVEANDGKGGTTIAYVTINLNDLDEIVLGLPPKEKISLYPNPVVDWILIETTKASLQHFEVFLYSSTGKLIPTNIKYVSESKQKVTFQRLGKGVYVIQIPDLEYQGKIFSN